MNLEQISDEDLWAVVRRNDRLLRIWNFVRAKVVEYFLNRISTELHPGAVRARLDITAFRDTHTGLTLAMLTFQGEPVVRGTAFLPSIDAAIRSLGQNVKQWHTQHRRRHRDTWSALNYEGILAAGLQFDDDWDRERVRGSGRWPIPQAYAEELETVVDDFEGLPLLIGGHDLSAMPPIDWQENQASFEQWFAPMDEQQQSADEEERQPTLLERQQTALLAR